jgi:signal transduction histidine kinase
MSHELRTPLNAIIGFAEVMMMGLAGKLDPQAMRTTERIHHNSERLLGLIDDLLDISKIEAGRLEIVRQAFAPSDLLKDVERNTRQQAIQKGLEFIARVDPALHSQRLEQIMWNLVTNAIKFTDKGTVSLAMLQADGDKWSIEVADTGVGIPAHAQEFIFDKFRQVDGTSRRAYGGAGLGLAIVRELALLMEGTVRVQSKVGIGSTFTVTLPRVVPGKGHGPDGQR